MNFLPRPILLLLAVGLIAVAGISAGPPPQADRGLDRARDVANENAAMLDQDGIFGIGVGITDGGAAVIRVFTATSGTAGVPSSLGGFDVETVVSGRFDAQVDPKGRFPRPVPLGVSTGHPNITAGTIGLRVKDGQGHVYALSNNHVFADVNSANIGDNVLQPGLFDGGADPADAIGTLADYQPLKFGKKETNTIDAAIALTTVNDVGNATPEDDGYGTPSATTVPASINQLVQKYGRTTGLTHGRVSELGITVDVCYVPAGPRGCKKSARFLDQIGIVDLGGGGNFSAGGDSGSSIVTDDGNNNPVGLLFAGSSVRTLANDIDDVLARFGVTIDAGSQPQNDGPVVTISSPAGGATFGTGAAVSFGGTATDTEDGVITGSLSWTSSIAGTIGSGGSFSTTLSDGVHTITASVIDSGGKAASDSVSITVGDPPATVGVSSIDIFGRGGKNADKHVNAKYTVQNDAGQLIAGAVVDITLRNDSGQTWSGVAPTGSDGTVTFSLKGPPAGCYSSTVNNVTSAGLTWDGATPAHDEFCK